MPIGRSKLRPAIAERRMAAHIGRCTGNRGVAGAVPRRYFCRSRRRLATSSAKRILSWCADAKVRPVRCGSMTSARATPAAGAVWPFAAIERKQRRIGREHGSALRTDPIDAGVRPAVRRAEYTDPAEGSLRALHSGGGHMAGRRPLPCSITSRCCKCRAFEVLSELHSMSRLTAAPRRASQQANLHAQANGSSR